MYGRGRRVVMPYADPKPLPALFYGFSSKGPVPIVVTALQLFDVSDLECPTVGPDGVCGVKSQRGACQTNKMCKCNDGFLGFACQFDCPRNEAMNNSVCSGTERGTCGMEDSQAVRTFEFVICQAGRV